MASKQQLFALLATLEQLPEARVPLDAARARMLGVPTRPADAFAGAVEALFHFLEQPRPDMNIVEALVDVLEYVTASPGMLRRTLGLSVAFSPPPAPAPAPPPHPRDMSPAPLPPEPKKGKPKSEEQRARIVPAPPSAAEALLATPENGWVTGDVISRQGAAAFAHLVHGRDDPKAALPGKGARDPLAWKKTVQKGDLAEWRKKILDLLATHGPSTYNALSVHATGLTADITFQELPDKALWSLVSDGLVEHTLVTPILFRLVQRRKGAATACGVPAPAPKKKRAT